MIADGSAARELIVERLEQDLVGPRAPDEVLAGRPTDFYLTGILWPARTRMGGEEDERLATGSRAKGDDGQDSEAGAVPPTSIQKPSVAGVSFCVSSSGETVVDRKSVV